MHLSSFLSRLGCLEILDLSRTEIGDVGVEYLFSAICNLRNMKELCLIQNNIGDRGAEFIAKMILHFKGATHLDLYQNEIGDDGARVLIPAVAKMPPRPWMTTENPMSDFHDRLIRDCIIHRHLSCEQRQTIFRYTMTSPLLEINPLWVLCSASVIPRLSSHTRLFRLPPHLIRLVGNMLV